MKLIRAEIEGYRSVREKVELFVESNVTVVLGPSTKTETMKRNCQANHCRS